MSTVPSPLTAADRERLRAHGIAEAEAERQLALLANPPRAVELVRPCTPGDGIERLTDDAWPALEARHDEAVAAGRVSAFVPASGAASRMFRDLLAYEHDPRTLGPAEIAADRAADRSEAAALAEFIDGLPRFAFHDELERALAARGLRLAALRASGPYGPILAAALDADGLGLAARPKGLVPFHLEGGVPHTAFEAHLSDAALALRSADGRVHVEATVATGHEPGFEACVQRITASASGLRFEVRLTDQDPATDTVALDEHGQPFRDANGVLVLRPAGHGALLANLAATRTPIAFLRNIDNIAAAWFREPARAWMTRIVGRLCELRTQIEALAARLDDPHDAAATDDALRLVHAAFGASVAAAGGDPAARREAARRLLDRPLRVCGMVSNTGDTGGGPFWVRERDGTESRQIVESAQVSSDPAQRALLHAATHFNPVFLACHLDDFGGRRYDLERFVDHDAAIVTRKSSGERPLLALERPGLWNGGMARWNTVFVEVPVAVFNPVKTVNDLLRPEHQPAPDA